MSRNTSSQNKLEAIKKGLKVYQGDPCKHEHVGLRLVETRQCIECIKINKKEYRQRPEVKEKTRQYKKRPDVNEKAKQYKRQYNQRPEVKTRGKENDKKRRAKSPLDKELFRSAKQRAKNNNLPFDLTIDYIKSIWPKDNCCPITKKEFVSNKNTGLKIPNPNAPSIDKIIPEKGYIQGNVCIISHRANTMKLNETDPEVFKSIARYLENNLLHQSKK